ncbi:hypothetical protein M422DRAFT_23982 [Sphaerobolus stellatus SS14]|nr:hypothetical protein M422DRAFT_23982 [Sphaerobolus stellatus SS14]
MATVSTPERRTHHSEARTPSSSLNVSRSANLMASPSRQHSMGTLTLEAALSSVDGDVNLALENVLAERNMLSSQNTQLWKLIEKQRAVHGGALKELERVRAERDRLLGKEGSAKKSHPSRTNSVQQSDSGVPTSQTNDFPTPELNSHRPPATRHMSEEDARRISPAPTPSLSSSRSHEPLRPSESRVPSASMPVDSLPPKINGLSFQAESSTGSISQLNQQTKPDLLSVPSPTVTSPSTQPLLITKPRLSPTEAPSPIVSLPPAVEYPAPSTSRPDSPTQTSSSPQTPDDPMSNLLVPSRNRAAARESRITLPDEARRYIASMQDSPMPSPSSRQTAFQSADVRLVEEQKEEQENNLPSASESSSGSPQPTEAIPSPKKPTSSLATSLVTVNEDAVDKGAFLEMEDDDDDVPDTPLEEHHEVPLSLKAGTGSLPLSLKPGTGSFADQQRYGSHSSTHPVTEGEITPQPWKSTNSSAPHNAMSSSLPQPLYASSSTSSRDTTVSETNPQMISSTSDPISRSPPSYGRVSPSGMRPSPSHQTSTQAQVQAQRMAYAQAHQTGYSQDPRIQQAPPVPQAPQSYQPQSYAAAPPAAYPVPMAYATSSSGRRLHPEELLSCRVFVTGSHIRPNDRGKEVLSFVVQVCPFGAPDRGETWKIEKLYSDVLALDSKVRNGLNRSSAKKLANLPDSKLFKDNAPAKVDLRKTALETYLQSVLKAPVKEPKEICDFFNMDIMKEASVPVTQSGYKEGYLTKRGKNFGGWKTRYFVLQGPVLEYYESRGGAHLGSIQITGAQIGRQQKNAQNSGDEENEYRHAFLIIENKKGANSQSTRHVLCAESDQERDAWVDVLVRYVMGTYDDTGLPGGNMQPYQQMAQSRPSMSSIMSNDSTVIGSTIGSPSSKRGQKPEITKGIAIPNNSSSQETLISKPFPNIPLSESASSSPLDRYAPNSISDRALQAINEDQISASLPSSFEGGVLSRAANDRSASALGHYGDTGASPYKQQPSSTDPRAGRDKKAARRSMHPGFPAGQSLSAPNASLDRAPSPEGLSPSEMYKPKISGPMNGTPIPDGYKFGAKDTPSNVDSSSDRDRDRKAKSRNLGGLFGRIVGNSSSSSNDRALPNGNGAVVRQVSRAVFGVALPDALQVAMIARLPAVVFRCIQYLEAKNAEREEGIYRLSGSSAVIKALKDRFNTEGDVDLLASDEFWDPHAIAGLLKGFLRELPTSVLTRDLHLKFLAVIDLADPEDRINELASLIEKLPDANYVLLRALTAHLILIVQNANINKMTMRNVGIVFSPTLGIPAGVFSLMLGEFNRVFRDDPAELDANGERRRGAEPASSSDNRNSRNYADAATDKLLGLAGRSLKQGDESDSGDEITIPDSASGNDTEDPDATTTFARSTGEPSSTVHEDNDDSLSPARGGGASSSGSGSSAKASSTAASRGLEVKVDHRRSVVSGQGLPHSPRPAPRTPAIVSPPSTPH